MKPNQVVEEMRVRLTVLGHSFVGTVTSFGHDVGQHAWLFAQAPVELETLGLGAARQDV